jgi:hypothetical protein
MAKTAKITLTSVGSAVGLFSFYSDSDNYTDPFETGITPASLLAGYTTTLIPDDASTIRVKREGCDPYLDIKIPCYTCDNCTDPFDLLFSAIVDAKENNPSTSWAELFGIVLDIGSVTSNADVMCCPNCYNYVFASVETYLKYAEAVGLTESAPVP